MLSWVIIVILVLVAPSVYLQSEDEIIDHCKNITDMFTANEESYIDPYPDYLNEAVGTIPFPPEIQFQIYEKIKRQRVFECITDHTDKETQSELEINPKYQALVNQCKSEWTGITCDAKYPYRTINGSCNNLLHPNWGAVLNHLQRFETGQYIGAAGFRQSVCGGPLPEPRYLSLNIHEDKYRPTKNVTHMLTFFGMLIAHDCTFVGITYIGIGYIDCCIHPKDEQHPACIPIYMDEDDPFYSMFNVTCFNALRTAQYDTCSVGKRNQMNQMTSYIDLSFIYGLSDALSEDLRVNDSAKLKAQYREAGELPSALLNFGFCGSEEKKEYCFETGDIGVNLTPPTMGLQGLFIREHNRLVDKLSEMNPCWNYEIVFQEARKINIAQMQVMVYNELIELLIGEELMTEYELWIQSDSCTTYNSSVDATLLVEFTTAAYRLHSIINSNLTEDSLNAFDNQVRNVRSNVRPLYRGKMDAMFEGLCTYPAQKYDRFVTVEMTDFLYRVGRSPYGLDIAALHIQRGRDNGIPTYIEMVNYLSNGEIIIETFDDLIYFMDRENIVLLQTFYCDVRDIDLWVGMTNERVPDDMQVGPTAAKIIAIQMSYWKFGDRFYVEHCGNFNEDQLQSLRNTSISSILCLNTGIPSIQSKPLLFPGEENPTMMCSDIPSVDLNLWKAAC